MKAGEHRLNCLGCDVIVAELGPLYERYKLNQIYILSQNNASFYIEETFPHHCQHGFRDKGYLKMEAICFPLEPFSISVCWKGKPTRNNRIKIKLFFFCPPPSARPKSAAIIRVSVFIIQLLLFSSNLELFSIMEHIINNHLFFSKKFSMPQNTSMWEGRN